MLLSRTCLESLLKHLQLTLSALGKAGDTVCLAALQGWYLVHSSSLQCATSLPSSGMHGVFRVGLHMEISRDRMKVHLHSPRKIFSRMRSEGFPFIVWGFGGWTLVRLEWLVGSSSRRRGVVNSVSRSCKTSPFRRFPRRLSCRFAWQAWHFVTFQPV